MNRYACPDPENVRTWARKDYNPSNGPPAYCPGYFAGHYNNEIPEVLSYEVFIIS